MEFKPIAIEDKYRINGYLRKYPPNISDLTFTNLFAWQKSKRLEYAEHEGHLMIRFNGDRYLQPVGPDPAGMIRKIGGRFERVDLGIAMNTGLPYEPDPAHDDYLYSMVDMAELAGDKYRAKRNFVNRIATLKPDVCELTAPSVYEFLELNKQWCKLRDCHSNEELSAEYVAVTIVLENFDKLGVSGVFVRIDGKPEAFAIGEPLNHDTYVEHFEVAGQIKGSARFML